MELIRDNAGSDEIDDDFSSSSSLGVDGNGDDDLQQTAAERESAEEEALQVISKKEDRWVWRLRVLTALVLIAVAAAVCATVYVSTRNSERNDFEQDFSDMSEKLVTSFRSAVVQRFGTIENYGMDLTAYADSSGQQLSLCARATLYPSYQGHFTPVANHVFDSATHCFGATTTRLGSIANQGWVQEALAAQMGMLVDGVAAPPTLPNIMKVHYGGPPKPEDSPGPHFPMWMPYPVSKRMGININMMADQQHKEAMQSAVRTGVPAFERATDYWGNETEKDGRYNSFLNNEFVDYQDDPFSVAFFPIFDRNDENDGERKVAALVLCIVYWRTYFDELLPRGADGIIVVLENTCEQQYTYQVDGSHCRFVGHGDLHDTTYDYLGVTGTDLKSIIDHRNDEQQQQQELMGCHFSIRVYPSEQYEESHYSNKPAVYAVVLASLFLFTTAVFIFL